MAFKGGTFLQGILSLQWSWPTNRFSRIQGEVREMVMAGHVGTVIIHLRWLNGYQQAPNIRFFPGLIKGQSSLSGALAAMRM